MKIDWQKGEPPEGVLLLIRCDDYTGEYTMKAMRKDYKKSPNCQKKGFKKGWRWIDEKGFTLHRKQQPDAWAIIEN